MTTWEYLKTVGDTDLATLGRQGWELVAVGLGEAGGGPVYYFKRPAPDFRDRVTLEQKQRYYESHGHSLTPGGES